MKKYTWILGSVIVFSAAAFAGRPTHQETEFTVKMTLSELNAIVTIIDDAPVDGKTRKHLIGRISSQVQPQLQDTTKPKR
jgi:hypothetical protein